MNSTANSDAESPLPVLLGCTASGKTGILLKLAAEVDFQVINADSRQIYRHMDIGTAKPSPKEMQRLPHHLIDIMDPDGTFSAGEFVRRADELTRDLRQKGIQAVVSGGTALYILALTGGLDPMPERCEGLRRGLRLLNEEVPGALMEMLRELDAESACRIGDNDIRRQIRALEICILAGRPASRMRRGGDPARRSRYRVTGIRLDEDEHRRRISARTAEMLNLGLIREVEQLLGMGWGRNSALGRTIGYSEVLDYLDGGIATADELRRTIESNTWKLVRRQKNMFRRISHINWVPPDASAVCRALFSEGGV